MDYLKSDNNLEYIIVWFAINNSKSFWDKKNVLHLVAMNVIRLIN